MKSRLFSISKYMVLLALAGTVASCDGFLDELPDNRMTITNADELSKLLISAYPTYTPAFLLETYSDNVDENIGTSWTGERFQEEAWKWQDITTTGNNESPQDLWNGYYRAISSANEALQDMNGIDNTSAAKGEALICRAFNMFKLSEIFCQAYDPATATTDLGLPYPTVPEKNIGETYTRGTLEELYKKIDADIQEALPLITNDYDAPKFHFTRNAAYAFACRFYLNYRQFDKSIEYATKVLGDTPSTTMLRDWATWSQLSANQQIQPNDFVSSKKNANLLLLPAISQWGLYCGPYSAGMKYRYNNLISTTEVTESTGPWGNSGSVLGYRLFKNNSFPGPMIRNVLYAFEYTDVQAGIGYPHTIIPEFTTDQLLMERAEAYALSGNYEAAVKDLNSELAAYQIAGSGTLTLAGIRSFYNSVKYGTPNSPTVKKQFNTTLVTDKPTQEPLLQCILHLDRIMTLHQGFRLQYVKRYGITIYRRSVDAANKVLNVSDQMDARDPRLAIQLPKDVITAGLEANPRN